MRSLGKRTSISIGQHRLAQLAAEGAAVADVEVLHQLLGDGAAALADLAGAHVLPRGARDPERRDAGVAEEAGVFGGEHRIDDVTRQLVEPQRPALAQLGVVVGVEERSPEGDRGVAGQRAAVDP